MWGIFAGLWAASVAAAFVAGLWVSYDHFKVGGLKARLELTEARFTQFRRAVGVSDDIEQRAASQEEINREVEAAIQEKINAQPKDAAPTVCVPSDLMRAIGKLR